MELLPRERSAKLLKQPKANLSDAGLYNSSDPEGLCRAVMARQGPGSQITLEGRVTAPPQLRGAGCQMRNGYRSCSSGVRVSTLLV